MISREDAKIAKELNKEGIKRIVNNHTSFASSRLRVNQGNPTGEKE
jgi:hypothetical protein